MKKIILLISLVAMSHSFASPRDKAKLGHIMVGVSGNVSPATFRIGGKAWEAGLLASGVAGIMGMTSIGGSGYAGLGIGVNYDSALAFYGALGADLWDFSLFAIESAVRVELGASTDTNNLTTGHMVIGFTFGY